MACDIYMHVYRDDPLPVLLAAARHLPDMRRFVIGDGGMVPGELPVTEVFTFKNRLKTQPHGGAWVKRWFQLAVGMGSEVALKVDPDSKIHRPFNAPMPVADAFGARLDSRKFGSILHGGSLFVSRSFMVRALPLLDNPLYQTPAFTMANGTASSDKIIADIAKILDVPLTAWGEVTFFPRPWENMRYAISHGRWHKELPPPAPSGRM